MGVDFYACSKCSDTFPDCGEYQYCEVGHHMCPACMVEVEEDFGGELHATDCPVCQMGGDDLERMTKERDAARDDVRTLIAAIDAWRKDRDLDERGNLLVDALFSLPLAAYDATRTADEKRE